MLEVEIVTQTASQKTNSFKYHPAQHSRRAMQLQPSARAPLCRVLCGPSRAQLTSEEALQHGIGGLIPVHVARQEALRDTDGAPPPIGLQPPVPPVDLCDILLGDGVIGSTRQHTLIIGPYHRQ